MIYLNAVVKNIVGTTEKNTCKYIYGRSWPSYIYNMNNKSSHLKKIRLKKYCVVLFSILHNESCQAFIVKSYLSLWPCAYFPGKSQKLEPGSDNKGWIVHGERSEHLDEAWTFVLTLKEQHMAKLKEVINKINKIDNLKFKYATLCGGCSRDRRGRDPTDPFQEAKKDSMHIPHLIIC